MKDKKQLGRVLAAAFGLALAAAGLYAVKSGLAVQGIMRALPYVCIGAGCGIFGGAVGELVARQTTRKHPEVARRAEIEARDERNIAIEAKAKAKGYDMMIYVFGALQFAFALMGADLSVVLLLVFAYLLVVGYGVYWRVKLDKEM